MKSKTTEEKVTKGPDAELAERFGVRPQMAHGEMEVANCDLKHGTGEAPQYYPYVFTEGGMPQNQCNSLSEQ